MRVAVVVGTRPEIVKVAELVRMLGDEAVLVHTGQHWDDDMAGRFFVDLGLPPPAHVLAIGGTSRGVQVGEGTARLTELLDVVRPDAVVVQGDTNTALAGALAANSLGRRLVHVEAGLRSFDRAMPEEHNRVLIDHIADLCAAPTPTAVVNLQAEAIPEERIVLTGNTVVEAVRALTPQPAVRRALLERLGLTREGYALATIHRPENTDDGALLAVLEALARLPLPVVLPLHPRTRSAVERAGAQGLLDRLRTLPPQPYADFLGLLAETAVAVSDSGGVQEEVTVLGRPVVVLRRSTERPEGVGTWSAMASVGPELDAAVAAALADPSGLHERLLAQPSPYGDGTASERTVAATRGLLGVAS